MSEEFGECLRKLIKSRAGESVQTVADALEFEDRSTVYRWLRGEKPPSLNSGYVTMIVERLKLNPIEARSLREAQVYSLEHRPPRNRARQSPSASAPNYVAPLIDSWRGSARSGTRHGPTSPGAQGAPILQRIIDLLESAPFADGPSDEARTITLTWQSDDPIEMSANLQEHWNAVLKTMLRRRWRIRYLCRLTSDRVRTMRLVEMMRELIGMGEYLPSYFTTYGALTPPYDLLIVPGHFAAALFSGASARAVDDGVIVTEPHDIEALQAHARQLAEQTTPLLTRYLAGDARTLEELLLSAESHPGGRLAIKDGLSVTTQPEAWYAAPHFTRYSSEPSAEDLKEIAKSRHDRIIAFKRALRQFDCYDICSLRAVEKLARDRVYPQDDALLKGQQALATVLEHLRHVVSLLRANPQRYHLALVDDQQAAARGATGIPLDMKWSVTSDRSVFMGVRLPDAGGSSVAASVHITEPTVAEAFEGYFQQLWNRIAPPNRDSATVIGRLESLIANLEAEQRAQPD